MSLYPDFGVPALSPVDRQVLLRGQGKCREIKDFPSKRGYRKRKQVTPGDDRDGSQEGKRRKINFQVNDAEAEDGNLSPKKHLRVTLQRITKPFQKWVTQKPKTKSLSIYLPSKRNSKDEESSGDVVESCTSPVIESKINNTENNILEIGKQVGINMVMFRCHDLESLHTQVQNEGDNPPKMDIDTLHNLVNDRELDVHTFMTPTTGIEDPISTNIPSNCSKAGESVGDVLEPRMCLANEGTVNVTKNDVFERSKQVQNKPRHPCKDLDRMHGKIVQNDSVNPPTIDSVDEVNKGETELGPNLTPIISIGDPDFNNVSKVKVIEESSGNVDKSYVGDDFLPPGYGSDKLAKVIVKVLEEKVKVTDSHSERELFRNTIHVLQCRGCKDREKHNKCRRCEDRDRRRDAEKQSRRNGDNSSSKSKDKVYKREVGGKPPTNSDNFSSEQVSKASSKCKKSNDNTERPKQANEAQGGGINKYSDTKTKDLEKCNVGYSNSYEKIDRRNDSEKKSSKNDDKSKKLVRIDFKEVGGIQKTHYVEFSNKQVSTESKSSCKSRESHEYAEQPNQSKEEQGGHVNKFSGTKLMDSRNSKMPKKHRPYEDSYITPSKRVVFNMSPKPPSPGSGLVFKSILKSTNESPKSPTTPLNVTVGPILGPSEDKSPSPFRGDSCMSPERSLILGTNVNSIVGSFSRSLKNKTVG